jgi:hypothetical protein
MNGRRAFVIPIITPVSLNISSSGREVMPALAST